MTRLPDTSRHPAPWGIAMLGGGLIAITYGLARFVFGLFLPAMRSDLGLDATSAGIIGALPYVSFIAAILAGPALCRRLGPRLAGALAAGLAAAGLATMAVSPDAVLLGVGVTICGLSTGLSSPVMAATVHRAVRPGLRARVNAIHNAGTSVGVALGLPAVAWLMEAWRSAYLAFAAVAVAGALAALAWLPRAHRAGPATAPPPARWETATPWRAVTRLGLLAAGMGLVSAIYWVFAPDLVTQAGGLSGRDGGWMWLALGTAGLAGAAAGDLIGRLGAARTHALALALMAGALALAATAPDSPALAMTSAGLFGAAYMTLSGLYLVQGVRLMADRPALGPVLPLIATTAGQAAGAPLAGAMIDATGYTTSFLAFALTGVAVAAASRWARAEPTPPAAGSPPAGPPSSSPPW